jgi:HK97 family phage prohead protease
MDREKQLRQVEFRNTDFATRSDEEGGIFIEGYFAVFNSDYHIAPGMTESVAPGAFTNSLSGDIRALINHDTTLVLGRTSAHTFELREDAHGLWGRININPNDSDAMNLYERVKRGDVSGCSFGFFPVSEETEIRDDGSVHWTITDVDLYECSACSFPAYQETNITARSEQRNEILKRKKDAELATWKANMRERMNPNGNQSIDAEEETGC